MPEINYRYYPEPLLRSFLEVYFSKLGDSPADAAMNADAVINGTLRWIPAQDKAWKSCFAIPGRCSKVG